MWRFFYDHVFALAKEVGCMQVEIFVMQTGKLLQKQYVMTGSSCRQAQMSSR
jgi:hypothetical protein